MENDNDNHEDDVTARLNAMEDHEVAELLDDDWDNDEPQSNCCCRLVTTLVVLLFFAASVIAIGYLVYKTGVAKQLHLHVECQQCFSDYHNATGFDEGNKTCIFGPTKPSATVVTQAEFCGAPTCYFHQSYDGYRPTPYVMLFLSAVCSIAMSSVSNLFSEYAWGPVQQWYKQRRRKRTRSEKRCEGIKCVMPRCCNKDADWKRRCKLAEKKREEAFGEVWFTVSIFAFMNPYMWWWTFVVTIWHFVFIAGEVAKENYLTPWQKYEKIYLLWLSSGSVEVLLSMFCQIAPAMMIGEMVEKRLNPTPAQRKLGVCKKYVFNRMTMPFIINNTKWKVDEEDPDAELPVVVNDEPKEKLTIFFLAFLGLLVPPFTTHVFPGSFVFYPVFMLVIIPWCISSVIVFEMDEPTNSCAAVDAIKERISLTLSRGGVRAWLIVVLFRLIPTFVLTNWFEMSMTYMSMLYSGKRWDHVIRDEYANRKLECYFNGMLNEVSTTYSNAVGLLFS